MAFVRFRDEMGFIIAHRKKLSTPASTERTQDMDKPIYVTPVIEVFSAEELLEVFGEILALSGDGGPS